MNAVSTNVFTYFKDQKIFSGIASNLPKSFSLDQIWSDSIDVGFNLVSQKTGRLVTFVLYKEYGEDVKLWHFRPAYNAGDDVQDLKLFIYND